MQTVFAEATDENCDAVVQSPGTILAVWMPIANADRPSTISNARAGVLCVRAKNISLSNRVPAAFPAAKLGGGGGGGGFSAGAIAGIVISVVVGLDIIGGLSAWWFSKRRKAANAGGTVEKNVQTLKAAPEDFGSVQSPGTEVSELPTDWRRPELDAGKDTARFELPEQIYAKEMLSGRKNGRPAVELDGTIPGEDGNHRLA